eukprot:6361723-Pyramimonas_sp.AAC.1
MAGTMQLPPHSLHTSVPTPHSLLRIACTSRCNNALFGVTLAILTLVSSAPCSLQCALLYM